MGWAPSSGPRPMGRSKGPERLGPAGVAGRAHKLAAAYSPAGVHTLVEGLAAVQRKSFAAEHTRRLVGGHNNKRGSRSHNRERYNKDNIRRSSQSRRLRNRVHELAQVRKSSER